MGQTKPAKQPDTEPKDRIDLRLYNTIIIFDVYTVARSADAAREGLLSAIRADNPAEPTENVVREVTMRNSIRQSWVEQKPWYASDITDEEFNERRELTTMQLYEQFYERRG